MEKRQGSDKLSVSMKYISSKQIRSSDFDIQPLFFLQEIMAQVEPPEYFIGTAFVRMIQMLKLIDVDLEQKGVKKNGKSVDRTVAKQDPPISIIPLSESEKAMLEMQIALMENDIAEKISILNHHLNINEKGPDVKPLQFEIISLRAEINKLKAALI